MGHFLVRVFVLSVLVRQASCIGYTAGTEGHLRLGVEAFALPVIDCQFRASFSSVRYWAAAVLPHSTRERTPWTCDIGMVQRDARREARRETK